MNEWQPIETARDRLAGAGLAQFGSVWARFRLGWLTWAGRLANIAGWPCVAREGDYASSLGVQVRVRRSPLYTIITVNGIDVYFYRLTGGYDGVGFNIQPPFDAALAASPPHPETEGQ